MGRGSGGERPRRQSPDEILSEKLTKMAGGYAVDKIEMDFNVVTITFIDNPDLKIIFRAEGYEGTKLVALKEQKELQPVTRVVTIE